MAMEMETERRNMRPPDAEEVVNFMQSQEHDPTNPAHVTRELMKPFPQSALYTREIRTPGGGKKQLTYVQYQQVIRRLIHATGNRFDIDVADISERPWGQSKNGNDLALVSARVYVSIPALGTRCATGVQVVTVGSGEDMYKGAVSDGVKKAAQAFGVAIDLAGTDGEDTAPHYEDVEDMHGAAQMIRQSADARRQQQGQPAQVPAHQNDQNAQHRPNTQATGDVDKPLPPSGGRPASERQVNAVFAIAKRAGANPEEWAIEAGADGTDGLSSQQASWLIEKYGGPR